MAAYDGKTSLQMCSVFWQNSFCHLLFNVTSEAGWAGIVFMVKSDVIKIRGTESFIKSAKLNYNQDAPVHRAEIHCNAQSIK